MTRAQTLYLTGAAQADSPCATAVAAAAAAANAAPALTYRRIYSRYAKIRAEES